MNLLSRQSVTLLLLAALFLAPGLAAVYFYQHPQWLEGESTNKGDFVMPPLQILSMQKLHTSNKLTDNTPKWHVVLWYPEACEASCVESLDQLARIRLALGRRYYEVDEVILMNGTAAPVGPELTDKLQKLTIKVMYLSSTEFAALSTKYPKQRIFIANPEGFLVLSYAVTAESDDIYHDLKHLLTTTQTKSE